MKKYNITTKRPKKNQKYSPEDTHKECIRCKQIKLLDDFASRSKTNNRKHSYCKKCNVERSNEYRKQLKLKCVEYKGGKCVLCGYNKCLTALDFHHLDPTQKDFDLCISRRISFSEEIKKELDKCVLLCSNCHREEHYQLDNNLSSLLCTTTVHSDSRSANSLNFIFFNYTYLLSYCHITALQ